MPSTNPAENNDQLPAIVTEPGLKSPQRQAPKQDRSIDKEMDKVLSDIQNIPEEIPDHVSKRIMDETIEEYANGQNILPIAARAQIIPYIYPTMKNQIDKEVMTFYAKFDSGKFLHYAIGSPESTRLINTVKILSDEGYKDYFVLAMHFADHEEVKNRAMTALSKLRENVKKLLEVNEKVSFEEKENKLLSSDFIYPEARRYLDTLKESGKYRELIEEIYTVLSAARMLNQEFLKLDCDERSLIMQSLLHEEFNNNLTYLRTKNHAVLKFGDHPIVLDTLDFNIRSTVETAKQIGYSNDYNGSYFWRDSREHYLAIYDSEDKQLITGYKRVAEKAYLVTPYYDISELVNGLECFDESQMVNIYRKAIEISPNNAEAYNNLANSLRSSGQTQEAVQNYKKALEINPHFAEASSNLGAMYALMGQNKEASIYLKKAMLLDPLSAETYYALAKLNYQEKKYYQAFKLFMKSLLIENTGKFR